MAQDITIKKDTFNKILAALVILAVGFSFTAGYIVGGGGLAKTGAATGTGGTVVQQPTAQAPQQQAPAPEGRVAVSLDDDPVVGSGSVNVIEFSDFQCPFCGRAFSDAVAGIKADYVTSGKVKFAYRDFPLDSIHPQAVPGALAANCALEQGKFWEYHDKIFQNQNAMGDASYKQWAADLGLDATAFNNCYDTQKYASEVQKDFQDGVNAGVSGTPTFFIGNDARGYIKIVGAQPYSVIKAAIDQELAS